MTLQERLCGKRVSTGQSLQRDGGKLKNAVPPLLPVCKQATERALERSFRRSANNVPRRAIDGLFSNQPPTDISPGHSPSSFHGGPDELMDTGGDALDDGVEGPEAMSRRVVDAFIRLNRYNQHHLSSSHNWGRRREATRSNWRVQQDALVDAYLAFIHSAASSGAPQPVLFPQFVVPAEDMSTRTQGCIHLVDISGIYRVPLSHFSGRPHANAMLLHHGYLGSAPVHPSLAFSIRTLLLFGRLRTRARTGKHNFVRALCDLHNITFNRSFRNRFSEAVDALSAVQRCIDNLVNDTLGRDNEWRMREGCPACSYQCVGEEPLLFARQVALDGNSSMKRFITSNTALESRFPSSYIRPREEVDAFRDEVQRPREPAGSALALPAETDAAGDGHGECTERWRNARPESEKTASWEALDETGIFPCVCRHGFVVTATDMWQSGELAKYPLSIDKLLIDMFGHEGQIQVGYDIGCAHSVTAGNSSFGDLAKRHIRFVVGSFHGHAHERLCQLKFHPRYVIGSGREDFEGCERLFSVNNFIASLVRHATRYHRHELIEASFKAWDSEKYASLGALLASKFREAKAKIVEHAAEEHRRTTDPRYTAEYLQSLLDDEYTYLAGHSTVSQLSIQDQLVQEYSSALRRWWRARTDREKFGGGANPIVQHGAATDVQIRKWLGAQRRFENAENDLQGYEERLGIAPHERWTADSPQYLTASNAKKLQSYYAALDALERGVADRLAVLEKLNKRETCYKMRRQISQSVKQRGTALAGLLQKYNDAARALEPPRPTLTRDEVFDLAFLADFPVLRPDVAEMPWAQRAVRQMTTAWAETARAQEELTRVRIECARVRAWIRDEEPLLDAHVARLERSPVVRDRLLACELDARAQLLFHQHSAILKDLCLVDEMDGISAPRPPGLRPVQHPDLATATRAASRTRRPPFPPQAPERPFQSNRSPVTGPVDVEDDVSDPGSVLDEVEGANLDGFFTALQALTL